MIWLIYVLSRLHYNKRIHFAKTMRNNPRTIGGKNGLRQYTLHEKLGEGAFGSVFSSPPFAIKEIQPSKVRGFTKVCFQKEISILKGLDHPNVVKLQDCFQENGHFYIVMQRCEMDLDQFVRINRVDERQTIQIIKQVACGLKYLVKNGIIHRDLKPPNILVNSRGEFKIADFGLSKKVNNFEQDLLGTTAGSPIYMDPLILQEQKYTTKCDIWSMGIIFYELLTKSYPWHAPNQKALAIEIHTKPLRIPANLSPWSKTLLSRMLVIDEKQRIGWDQLFEYLGLNAVTSPRPRIVTGEDRPNSAAKSDRPDRRQVASREKSAEKIQKYSISYPEHSLKELLYFEIVSKLGVTSASRILRDSSYKPTKAEAEAIKDIFSCYRQQFQEWARRQYPSLRQLRGV